MKYKKTIDLIKKIIKEEDGLVKKKEPKAVVPGTDPLKTQKTKTITANSNGKKIRSQINIDPKMNNP